ncbi:putative ribonuclease H-like domain-containing protein [Tanacetum coccineum]
MDDFYREKGIKIEYSIARTPQQNGVAERTNRTLIEAARIMLADSKLPTTFWAEAASLMAILKDASYFDSLSKDVGNDKPKFAANDIRQVEDGPHNESDDKDKSEDDSIPMEDNAAGQHINIASPEVNTGYFEFNIVDPLVNTASSYDPHSLKDMFKVGASHTLEATHVEFFSDEDEPWFRVLGIVYISIVQTFTNQDTVSN